MSLMDSSMEYAETAYALLIYQWSAIRFLSFITDRGLKEVLGQFR